jgi:pimeloyl-ACP methyl ester carboxylesterase
MRVAPDNARPLDGPGEQSDAQEILLIHDHPWSPLVWGRVELLLRDLGLLVRSAEWPADAGTRAAAGGAGVARLLGRAPGPPVVVVGHGAGAITALMVAACAPERVGAVVLVAPIPIPRSVLGAGPTTRYGAARTRIRCPAVVVSGGHDSLRRSRSVGALLRLLPHSHRIATQAGHLIPLEDPDAVVRAVLHAMARAYQQSVGSHRPDHSRQWRTSR